MRIRVGHLYPEYLNIYADRGNIAVLARRAALRGHELLVEPVGLGDTLAPRAHDLLYVGGGQDREQALVAPDLAAKGDAITPYASGAALLAVCGGYQLLGRGYRGRDGSFMPGAGLFGHETVAGDTHDRGCPARVRAHSGARNGLAGFENHKATVLDPGSAARSSAPASETTSTRGYEGCRPARACICPARSSIPEPVAGRLAPCPGALHAWKRSPPRSPSPGRARIRGVPVGGSAAVKPGGPGTGELCS